MKKVEVLVRHNQDPMKVAIDYTRCLTCKKPLDFQWRCGKCKTQLFFKCPEVR